jgi:predicted small lipoprotein YifL
MRVRWVALLTSLIILTACGQKGPLYIPQNANASASADQKVKPTSESQSASGPVAIEQQVIGPVDNENTMP